VSPHFPTASDYSAGIILFEKPQVVCVELHQSVVEDFMRVMKLPTRTPEEEKFYKAEEGDGVVAMMEAAWEVGAEIYGIEPKRGYDVHESDYKTGLEGKFWKFLEKSWGKIHHHLFDKKAEKNPETIQTSFWTPKMEAARRWIWKHECFPAYRRVSLEREEFYASRLVELEKERGEDTKIFFFVNYGHKWNTLKEVQARTQAET